MEETRCYQFFLEPLDPEQRRYEALRAVFVDQASQKEVAARFGFSYAHVRRMASDFRRQCDQGENPFFSNGPTVAGR